MDDSSTGDKEILRIAPASPLRVKRRSGFNGNVSLSEVNWNANHLVEVNGMIDGE